MKLIDHKVLRTKTELVLKKFGSDVFSAKSVSKGLVETSLRGVDSHGIRLLPHYLNALQNGRINGKPKFKINNRYQALIGLDADNSFGHAAGYKSIEIGMKIAEEYGIAAISVMNSSHPGAMASFSLEAARKGFCSFSFTHADALIQSFNGKRPFFGTNPICFAAPRKDEEPFCVDMAPTFIPWNKVLEAREIDMPLENGVAVDNEGIPTKNPFNAQSLIGIGNYKGFALAAMVEVLCSTMSGMPFGPHISSMYKSSIKEKRKLGQFYLVFKNDINVDNEHFQKTLKKMTLEVRNQEPSQKGEKVLMPNDPQIITSRKRIKEGIPIMDNVYDLLFKR